MNRFQRAAGGTSSSSAKQTLRPPRDYFDDDDDDDDVSAPKPETHSYDDEIDPLDAFMAGVDATIKAEAITVGVVPRPDIVSGGFLDDDVYDGGAVGGGHDGDDARVDGDDDDDGDGDGEGGKKVKVEALAPIDHSLITYPPFKRVFYVEPPAIDNNAAATQLRKDLEISVLGINVPFPVQSLDALSLPAQLMKEITRLGYSSPTAIQAQGLPIALSGRDLIGLAKTGSGKTVSYLWPMIVQILAQPQMQAGDGPIGIVLSPTRELSVQIHQECTKFAGAFNIRTVCIYGGVSKWEMQKALKEEVPEIVVATPGRLIDLIRKKSTNLQRCTMLVLDECDRMFDLGFEYQMRSILSNIRPDAQKLLYSATMKKSVEGFAMEMLDSPVRIVVGTIGQANPDIRQVVHVVNTEEEKWSWLAGNADDFVSEGKVLIFCNTKHDTDALSTRLKDLFARRQLLIGIESLHGDRDQGERDSAMRRFSKVGGDVSILVATDVASRGLHVSDVRTVVNYFVPAKIDAYVHRIGRTGRMGRDGVTPGTAYTLLDSTTRSDRAFAEHLARNLQLSGQPIPPELYRLIPSSSSHSSSSSFRPGGGRGGGGGGAKRGIGHGQVALTSAMLANALGEPAHKRPAHR